MAIDLSQFHQVFFEESFEGLDIMESSLMELDPADIDSETINAIFRAAHSIKGGSATFGFSSIASFTHVLETLLDQVRAGTRSVSGEDINLFLKSVDCMREMLELLQGGDDGQTELSQSLEQRFTELLNNDGGSGAGDAASDVAAVADAVSADDGQGQTQESQSQGKGWAIKLSPSKDVLRTGNDPYRLVRELSELGPTTCITHLDNLPDFSGFDPEDCFLSWNIQVETDEERSTIDDIFEWIADESDISIEPASFADQSSTDENTQGSGSLWTIQFEPEKDILRTGNEPTKIFRALEELGTVHATSDISNLPTFDALDSEQCFVKWTLTLNSDTATQETIQEVFEWVMDEAVVNISREQGDTAAAKTEQAATMVAEETSPSPAEPAAAAPSQAAQAVENPAAAPVKKPVKAPAKAAKKSASAEASSIRVGIDKVDTLINMVGELVITQSMLGQLGTDFDVERLPKLMEGLGQLEQNTRELQESVMRIRMLPISFAFSRFPRMVRDLGQTLGKSLNLEMIGEHTELDKTVMEKIGDPLVHLVRNAVDHGIESPEDREAKGKDPTGHITLNAYHQGGNVVIEIVDDGKGLNPESLKEKAIEKGVITDVEAQALSKEQCFDLIFQPGFSTAATVSDVSGRGVGMDVVKRNIQALNGLIEIQSEVDKGSTIIIRLPLTLAILDGQLVRVGNNTYIFPLTSIIESMQCKEELINKVAGGCSVFKLRDDYVPIIELHKAFGINKELDELENSLMVVVESEGEKVGIVVDELLAQQQVVIKSLEQNYRKVNGISGATILGDGTVALILDIPGIVNLAGANFKDEQNSAYSFLSQQPEFNSQQIGA